MPAPPSTKAGKRSQKYWPSTGRRVSRPTDSAESSSPAVSVGRTPSRPVTHWAMLEVTTTVPANATNATPLSIAEYLSTSCRYSVRRKNSENATPPTIAIAPFAADRLRERKIRSGRSG
jgi:hypothetical protein